MEGKITHERPLIRELNRTGGTFSTKDDPRIIHRL